MSEPTPEGETTEDESPADPVAEIDRLTKEGATDPAEVAQAIYDKLNDDQRRAQALAGLVSLTLKRWHRIRSPRQNPTEAQQHRAGAAPKPGPAWSDSVRDSIKSGMYRIWVGNAHVELRNCTLEHLDRAITLYQGRAAANAAMAKRYQRLADEMRKRKVETAGELGTELLMEILYG